MNRRAFFKSLGFITAAIPLVGFASETVANESELNDLYFYLESKTILHPIHGKVPFKLYPFQKEILKTIHENDNTIIVKARQIGMTTLLAGYAAWLSHRRQIFNHYVGCEFAMEKHYGDLIRRLGIKSSNIKDNRQFRAYFDRDSDDTDFWLCYCDEWNFGCKSFAVMTDSKRKNVVCGTPDEQGILKKFIEHKNQASWKVVTYPATKCSPMWTFERIVDCKPWLSSCNHNTFDREILAQFS